MNGAAFKLKSAVIWLTVLLMVCACGQKAPSNVQIGTVAPDFSLKTAGGMKYRLRDLHGQVVLLSFLNIQAEVSANNADLSRSQVVFLRSMAEQYGPKGVHILILDASAIVLGQPASQDILINYGFDWHLEGIPVLMDNAKNATSRTYGVTQVPTTYLIDGEGIVQQRWDGFTPAQDLAFALQDLVGEPVYRKTME